MRQSVKTFVKICSENLPIKEPIYDFGSLQVGGQEGFADLRPYFTGKKYIGCDMRVGVGVDLILNLHDIELPDSYAGTVLLIDTIEHVEYVRKAMSEIYRILADDGILIMTAATLFHIHDFPYDYWRFTPEGVRSLLQDFAYSFVDYTGEDLNPHCVIGVGFKKPHEITDKFLEEINRWKADFKDKKNDY